MPDDKTLTNDETAQLLIKEVVERLAREPGVETSIPPAPNPTFPVESFTRRGHELHVWRGSGRHILEGRMKWRKRADDDDDRTETLTVDRESTRVLVLY